MLEHLGADAESRWRRPCDDGWRGAPQNEVADVVNHMASSSGPSLYTQTVASEPDTAMAMAPSSSRTNGCTTRAEANA